MAAPGPSNNNTDDSIIDVTGQSYTINPVNNLQKYNKVPHWAQQPVHAYAEINTASPEQKSFYETFRSNFVNNRYLDIEGNSNYAFILLFNLIDAFEAHRSMAVTEQQLNRLTKNYPATEPYAFQPLISKLQQLGEYDAIYSVSIKQDGFYSYRSYQAKEDTNNSEDNSWRIGTKYKSRLKLTEDEVALFDGLGDVNNNFCNIEYCCIQVIKFYLIVISKLTKTYTEEGTTIEAEFLGVADIIAIKHFKYRQGSENYKYGIETINKELYGYIFRYCENAVREYYGHKRKVSTDTSYTTAAAKTAFEEKIIRKVAGIITAKISKVAPLDEATEMELYARNTNRWKIKFDGLTANYNNNTKEFIDAVITLGDLNAKNPSIENIFFEASKFIAQHNRQAALVLYVHYLHHDLKSATFDNKQLTKTIQKSLFTTNEQLHDFEKIVSELIKDNNLYKALQSVSAIYEVKRKKIQLNTASIMEVQQQHAGTVELLNEYLRDDFEDESNTIRAQETNDGEIKIEITKKNEEVHMSAFVSELAFTEVHTTALELFAKSNFSLPQSELEAFARAKGIFKNQLVESINDTCYEFLDDILIEEEDEYYTINTHYFQNISAK